MMSKTARRGAALPNRMLSLTRRRQPVSLGEEVPADIEVLKVTAPEQGTAASAARTTSLAHRMPPMRPSPGGEPSRPRDATA
jgi:hypothetical protein